MGHSVPSAHCRAERASNENLEHTDSRFCLPIFGICPSLSRDSVKGGENSDGEIPGRDSELVRHRQRPPSEFVDMIRLAPIG